MRLLFVAITLMTTIVSPTSAMAQRGRPSTLNAGAICELHIWPTENYVGIKTGLLSAFGGLGAAADVGANKSRVSSVKDMMRDYLGPAAQLDELVKADVTGKLDLNGYRVVAEAPTPSNDDAKSDTALKARSVAMNARLKSGERLSTSTASCYAELVGTQIFYLKTMMYPGNLFAAWTYRPFPPTGRATRKFSGSVKNRLTDFPAKSDAMVDAAKADIRSTYAKDFAEYVAKKVGRRPE